MVCVSWKDAQAYVAWLTQKTGHWYRLLSEAEWEYAARAGTTTAAYWGDSQGDACAYANGADLTMEEQFPDQEAAQPCHDGYVYTAPVGSFKPNAFGLYDMLGNVFEMLADCYERTYENAPVNGSPKVVADCRCRSNRGGSWTSTPTGLRAAYRDCDQEDTRVVDLGFRVARRLQTEIDRPPINESPTHAVSLRSDAMLPHRASVAATRREGLSARRNSLQSIGTSTTRPGRSAARISTNCSQLLPQAHDLDTRLLADATVMPRLQVPAVVQLRGAPPFTGQSCMTSIGADNASTSEPPHA